MASKLLMSMGMNASIGSSIADVYLCDADGDKPASAPENSIALIKGGKWKIFMFISGAWTRINFDTKE